MPAPWSTQRNNVERKLLNRLYVIENKTIGEIALSLGMKEKTVYDRLKRFGFASLRSTKPGYNNRNTIIQIPKSYSSGLAEFIGILLGDGHITPTQVTVTLGLKEESYVQYVAGLMKRLFRDTPRIIRSSRGDWVVYIGSVELVRWFLAMGLSYNKVKAQVAIPSWCSQKRVYKKRILRGLFDTDGSVYALRHGLQISLCNKSQPLLRDARSFLSDLDFAVSRVSANKIYITTQRDLQRFYREIGFANEKHQKRFQELGKANSGRFA